VYPEEPARAVDDLAAPVPGQEPLPFEVCVGCQRAQVFSTPCLVHGV